MWQPMHPLQPQFYFFFHNYTWCPTCRPICEPGQMADVGIGYRAGLNAAMSAVDKAMVQEKEKENVRGLSFWGHDTKVVYFNAAADESGGGGAVDLPFGVIGPPPSRYVRQRKPTNATSSSQSPKKRAIRRKSASMSNTLPMLKE